MDITGWNITQITEACIKGTPGIERAIKENCARRSLAIAKAVAEMKCSADNPCIKKDCPHGDEQCVQNHIDHAAVLMAEAMEME